MQYNRGGKNGGRTKNVPDSFAKHQIVYSFDSLDMKDHINCLKFLNNKQMLYLLLLYTYTTSYLPESTALISLNVASEDINGLIKNWANLNRQPRSVIEKQKLGAKNKLDIVRVSYLSNASSKQSEFTSKK